MTGINVIMRSDWTATLRFGTLRIMSLQFQTIKYRSTTAYRFIIDHKNKVQNIWTIVKLPLTGISCNSFYHFQLFKWIFISFHTFVQHFRDALRLDDVLIFWVYKLARTKRSERQTMCNVAYANVKRTLNERALEHVYENETIWLVDTFMSIVYLDRAEI